MRQDVKSKVIFALCMSLAASIIFTFFFVVLPMGDQRLHAHEWYPWECCSGLDCAPVEESKMAGLNWVVTSKHGTVVVPENMKRRESKDGRTHICMRKIEGTMMPLCVFVPAGM